ncbi:hypothetical protein T484DRAFT_1768217, partial [Baffinella frigidus]
ATLSLSVDDQDSNFNGLGSAGPAVQGNLLWNRFADEATLSLSVDDQYSNFNGLGFAGPAVQVAVTVMPGFESNVQDSFNRVIQKGTSFYLNLLLDQPATKATNVSIVSSDPTAAMVTPRVFFPEGSVGPVTVTVSHQGRIGDALISLEVTSTEGNFAGVTAINYLSVEMMPGFWVSTTNVSVQHQDCSAMLYLGLDTRPAADTTVTITSQDPSVVGATAQVRFSALDWTGPEASAQPVSITWLGAGVTQLSLVAASPGGNYNRVRQDGLVTATAYRPLTVSRSSVLVQRGGVNDVSVSTPMKPSAMTTFTFTAIPAG